MLTCTHTYTHMRARTFKCLQEAELLCDRIGIFVEGQLVCLDTPSEVTSRFAGFLVLTVTVPQVWCGARWEALCCENQTMSNRR